MQEDKKKDQAQTVSYTVTKEEKSPGNKEKMIRGMLKKDFYDLVIKWLGLISIVVTFLLVYLQYKDQGLKKLNIDQQYLLSQKQYYQQMKEAEQKKLEFELSTILKRHQFDSSIKFEEIKLDQEKKNFERNFYMQQTQFNENLKLSNSQFQTKIYEERKKERSELQKDGFLKISKYLNVLLNESRLSEENKNSQKELTELLESQIRILNDPNIIDTISNFIADLNQYSFLETDMNKLDSFNFESANYRIYFISLFSPFARTNNPDSILSKAFRKLWGIKEYYQYCETDLSHGRDFFKRTDLTRNDFILRLDTVYKEIDALCEKMKKTLMPQLDSYLKLQNDCCPNQEPSYKLHFVPNSELENTQWELINILNDKLNEKNDTFYNHYQLLNSKEIRKIFDDLFEIKDIYLYRRKNRIIEYLSKKNAVLSME